jgi:ATP-dependent Clp protease ATP-binding subunit ClpX
MLDAMFEVPSMKNEKEFVVTLNYALEKFQKANLSQLKVA